MNVWRRTLVFRKLAVASLLVAVVALVAPTVLPASVARAAQVVQETGERSKPNVVILATGGTIAGSAATDTQAGYESGQVGVDVLISAVPELARLADITGEQISNIGSQDMSDAVWLQLARRINELLATDAVDGIVITHGTDTLEETSYFLNLVVESPKPVVMTAAMRPSTALSADGPLNLYNAVAVAADPNAIGRGVLVVANDDIHGARDVTKTNTTGVATFKSPLSGLIGETLYGINNYFRSPYKRHTVNSGLRVEGVEALPRVDIIYASAGMSADLIDATVALGAQGLVVAGVGNGNMTSAALEALGRARQNGVLCVRSTRVPTGAVGRNVEIDDDALGLVASGSLNPAKSRVLLKLALLHPMNPKEVQELFDIY